MEKFAIKSFQINMIHEVRMIDSYVNQSHPFVPIFVPIFLLLNSRDCNNSPDYHFFL